MSPEPFARQDRHRQGESFLRALPFFLNHSFFRAQRFQVDAFPRSKRSTTAIAARPFMLRPLFCNFPVYHVRGLPFGRRRCCNAAVRNMTLINLSARSRWVGSMVKLVGAARLVQNTAQSIVRYRSYRRVRRAVDFGVSNHAGFCLSRSGRRQHAASGDAGGSGRKRFCLETNLGTGGFSLRRKPRSDQTDDIAAVLRAISQSAVAKVDLRRSA